MNSNDRGQVMQSYSKRQQQARKELETVIEKNLGPWSLKRQSKFLRMRPNSKFDQTVEVHFRLGINSKLNDQQVRSTVNLPGGTGKEVRVAVVAKARKSKKLKTPALIIVGAEELVAKIGEGFIEFDKLVATPDSMAMLSKLGKLLGPTRLDAKPERRHSYCRCCQSHQRTESRKSFFPR